MYTVWQKRRSTTDRYMTFWLEAEGRKPGAFAGTCNWARNRGPMEFRDMLAISAMFYMIPTFDDQVFCVCVCVANIGSCFVWLDNLSWRKLHCSVCTEWTRKTGDASVCCYLLLFMATKQRTLRIVLQFSFILSLFQILAWQIGYDDNYIFPNGRI